MLIERQGLLEGIVSASLMTSMTSYVLTGDGRRVVKGIVEEILNWLTDLNTTSHSWRTRTVPQRDD